MKGGRAYAGGEDGEERRVLAGSKGCGENSREKNEEEGEQREVVYGEVHDGFVLSRFAAEMVMVKMVTVILLVRSLVRRQHCGLYTGTRS